MKAAAKGLPRAVDSRVAMRVLFVLPIAGDDFFLRTVRFHDRDLRNREELLNIPRHRLQ